MEYVSEDVLFEGVEEEGKIYRKNLALTVSKFVVIKMYCIIFVLSWRRIELVLEVEVHN
jgi:hypothetical protein